MSSTQPIIPITAMCAFVLCILNVYYILYSAALFNWNKERQSHWQYVCKDNNIL